MRGHYPIRASRHFANFEHTNDDRLPEELIAITNYLRDHHPADYNEISQQIHLSFSLNTPSDTILKEVIATLKADRPIVFRALSNAKIVPAQKG